MDELLKRKIDKYLIGWKNNPDRLPLFIRGARQIGKTRSIEKFAYDNYQSVVEINFVLKKQYLDIFDDGYDVDTIIKNISFKNPSFKFIPSKTLSFFDEIQANLNAATAMKSFSLDGRYDVICSGSLMGINYQEIESNSVGYKTDYDMKSLDFEEFLWAKGYSEEQLEGIFTYLKNQKPLPESIFSSLLDTFKEYVVVGGMPAIVKLFIDKKTFNNTLNIEMV